MTLPLGKILGEPSVVYHAAEACSHSKLEKFGDRAVNYRDFYLEKTRFPDRSDALDFGAAFHSLILDDEPQFAESPFDDFRTKEARQWRAAQQAQGKPVIRKQEMATLYRMAEALARHPDYAEFFNESTEREVTWRVQPSALSFPCQCRSDLFLPAGNRFSNGVPLIVDLKTKDEIKTPTGWWGKVAADYGYHRQDGFYSLMVEQERFGIGPVDFMFLVVEKQEPFGVGLYRLHPLAREIGKRETAWRLARLHECLRTGNWQEPQDQGLVEVELPRYYKEEGIEG